jgi:acyl-CoA synthetase (AMP-forming)/AMP-acid ligase II
MLPAPRLCLRSLTLRAALPDRFISDGETRIVINDLRTTAHIDVARAHGRSVLLRTRLQLPTALAAIELDGVAKRIVLCPPDQWGHLPSIIERATIDFIVTDEPDEGEYVDSRLRCAVWRGDRNTETEWILLTSGTTGLPKLAIHTLSSLTGPLENGVMTSDPVWSTFYDIRRYGGLQMLFRALLGRGSMILSRDDETPNTFLMRLAKHGVTHMSGTPSHWRRALMSPASTSISPSYVRLSGEIVDQAILGHLRRTYPGANIVHAFASTEAGVAFEVCDGKAGFPVSLIGNPHLHAELGVAGGTLHIRSGRTAKGYIGSPLDGFDGWIDTGDLVKKQGDRYYFAGRKEGVINVGGQKVYPEEVENILTLHPAIHMARVWARRSPVTGSLVAADIMLEPGAMLTDIRGDLIEHCRRHLPAFKMPVSIREVDNINLTPAGKIARA